MEITLLIKSFVGLVIILAILIFFLLYLSKKAKVAQKKVEMSQIRQSYRDEHSLENLLKIIKNKASTAKELKEALDLVIEHHGSIDSKIARHPHPSFDIYGEILFRICRHPNTNKNIIIGFNKALEKRNKEYKKEINDFITRGLNSRGA